MITRSTRDRRRMRRRQQFHNALKLLFHDAYALRVFALRDRVSKEHCRFLADAAVIITRLRVARLRMRAEGVRYISSAMFLIDTTRQRGIIIIVIEIPRKQRPKIFVVIRHDGGRGMGCTDGNDEKKKKVPRTLHTENKKKFKVSSRT